MIIEEDEGCLIINPEIFKQCFISCYENCFAEILSNNNKNYKDNALGYFNLLIK